MIMKYNFNHFWNFLNLFEFIFSDLVRNVEDFECYGSALLPRTNTETEPYCGKEETSRKTRTMTSS